ncbi:MAG: fumarylacetoacetate hydrolase family protein [Gemmatimonadetes bacterium]|nr:fumarylacetoacetate hydrolase family protein [Gemmatimonadota bacterium]
MKRPGKIICVGRNYLDHAKEMGGDVPKEPLLFLKPPSCVIDAGVAIELPPGAGRIDFEGEIGVVIGTTIKHADEATARKAIRGLVAANDVSAREWQKNDGQWARAKGCDTFLPLGDEAPAPADLSTVTVVTRHNGVEKQRATGGDMAFSIPTLIVYITKYITLEPGDLILTGTPAGVAELKPGDTVEVELVGLSKVSSPVAAGR